MELSTKSDTKPVFEPELKIPKLSLLSKSSKLGKAARYNCDSTDVLKHQIHFG